MPINLALGKGLCFNWCKLILGIPPAPPLEPPVEPTSPAFIMHYDDIAFAPVVDPTDVAQWNTFLVAAGVPFTAVTVIGNAVYLEGGVAVQLNASVFENNASIRIVEDSDGMVTSTGGLTFRDCATIQYVKLPGLTTVTFEEFKGCSSLATCSITNVTSIGDRAFWFSGITAMVCPLCVTVGSYAFNGCGSLVDADFRTATSLGDGAFNSAPLTGNTHFDIVDTIGEACFQGCSFTNIQIPLLANVSAAGGEFASNPNLVGLSFPFVTKIGYGFCANCPSLISLYLPLCGDFGGTTGDDFVFDALSGNTVTVTVPALLETCDGGNPDGDLVYLASNNTTTITYV